MSGAAACRCPNPRTVLVTKRNYNLSAFGGYRRTRSDYSEVWCRRCRQFWRTKANYVATAPDPTYAERQEIYR